MGAYFKDTGGMYKIDTSVEFGEQQGLGQNEKRA